MPKRPPEAPIAKPTETAFGVAREVRAQVVREGHELVRGLYTTFDVFNVAHFETQLPPATILVTKPASPRALGDHTRQDVHGIPYRIRLADTAAARGERFLADVLLHELVHVACNAIDGDNEPGYRGHGPKFAAWCNRIGERLGLPPVAPRGRGAPDCAQWPLNVRPTGYYPELPGKPKRAPKALPKGKASEDDGEGGDDGDRDERTRRGAELERAIVERERAAMAKFFRQLADHEARRDIPGAIVGERLRQVAKELERGAHVEPSSSSAAPTSSRRARAPSGSPARRY